MCTCCLIQIILNVNLSKKVRRYLKSGKHLEKFCQGHYFFIKHFLHLIVPNFLRISYLYAENKSITSKYPRIRSKAKQGLVLKRGILTIIGKIEELNLPKLDKFYPRLMFTKKNSLRAFGRCM